MCCKLVESHVRLIGRIELTQEGPHELAVAFFFPCGRRELLGPASGLPKLVLANWVATSSEAPLDRVTDLDRLLKELEEDATMSPLYFS